MNRPGWAVICLCTVVAAGSAAIAGDVARSTFDTDLDGWVATEPAEVAWEAAGGNPGGYLRFADVSDDVLTKLYAKEFVCELSRVLHGPDRVIFHMLVESSRSGEKRGSVIKAAACCLGISVPYVYQRVNTIKKAALKFLQDVA